MAITLVAAQRALLGIISSVEAGLTSPEEAVNEQADLRRTAPPEFRADYTLADFQRVQSNGASTYESSTARPEPVYEPSSSY